MKQKGNEWDREKKIRKVEKSNRVVKHRKTVYNYDSEEDLDEEFEQYRDQEALRKYTK